MNRLKNAKGFLFDLDGVFYQSGKALPGAVNTLSHLKSKNIPFRFLTNTTTKNRTALKEKLNQIGLPVLESEIISAGYSGVDFLRQLGSPTCTFYMTENLIEDYNEFEVSTDSPEAIVIGDYDKWNYQLMNEAFRFVMNGAEIVALHKGKYYQVDDGLRLDAGGFVKALEFATGKQAHIVGKPNKAFFNCAIQDINIRPENLVMIGDDLTNDIYGAQNVEIEAFLVKTGKYHEGMLENSTIQPDGILDSIKDLPKFL